MASDFGVCGRRLGIFGMSSACYPHSMYQRTVLIKKGASRFCGQTNMKLMGTALFRRYVKCAIVRNPRTFLNENHSLIHRGGGEKEGEKDEEGKREEEIMKKHLSDVESDL